MSNSFYGRPMEILLVEDSPGDAAITMRVLKDGRIRHRLSLVTDGEEALSFLQRQAHFARAPRPDLMLLDLQLPKMDGRELLDQIRANESLREIPIVVMTASPEHEQMIRSEHLQVEDYVMKPLDKVSFLELVRRLKSHWHADVILPVLD